MSTTYNPYSLDGKTILITGAASGIGKTTLIECSKLGAKLVAVDLNADGLDASFGGRRSYFNSR